MAAADARRRILGATRALLIERPFGELTVGAVMAQAGLARTVFYRYFDSLADLAADLLPDADDPLVAQAERLTDVPPLQRAQTIVALQVAVFAEHGRLLQAMDDAGRADTAFAARLETALIAPRQLLTGLLAHAPVPPPDPTESARVLMATHRAYLLDTFRSGNNTPQRRAAAIAALNALWERLLAPPSNQQRHEPGSSDAPGSDADAAS